MAHQLLATKLYPPPWRPSLVTRTHLLDQLNASLRTGHPLTLVCAPAGYGKTTLVAEWSRNCARPSAWLSLEPADNDPVRFLTYFAAALQKVHSDIGQSLEGLLSSAPLPTLESLATALINDVAAAPGPFLLVLDDYHTLTDPGIHELMNFIVDHQPAQMHLVITARKEPALPLARLRARGQITELRLSDLRFDAEEAAAFLNQAMQLNLSPGDIDILAQRTEGWIAGLQLAALSLHGQADRSAFVHSFSGDDRHVTDYLLDEVLSREPAAVQRFLLQTSILSRLSAPLCDGVLANGSIDSQRLLEQLDQANLFIEPLDNRRQWYRYHPLFADLLRRRLAPADESRLHHRAAAWFAQNGFTADAVDHAIAAQDLTWAAQLIEQIYRQLLSNGEAATLTNWLNALPATFVRSQAALCIARAWVTLMSARFEVVEPALQDAEAALGTSADQAGTPTIEQLHLLGEIDALRSTVAINLGDQPRSIALAQRALQRLSEQDFLQRSLLALNLGDAYGDSGDPAAAAAAYAEAVTASRAADSIAVLVVVLGSLGALQASLGQLHAAHETYRQACDEAEQWSTAHHGHRALPMLGKVHARMSDLLYEWNDLNGALRHAQQGLIETKQWGHLEHVLDNYFALARIHNTRSDTAATAQTLDEARQYLGGMTRPSPTLRRKLEEAARRLEQMRVILALQAGRVDEAERWVRARELRPENLEPRNFRNDAILARLLLAQGKAHEALPLLERLVRLAEENARADRIIKTRVVQACALEQCGAHEQALATLTHALALAEPGGYVRSFLNASPRMAHLLRHVALQDHLAHYAGRLLVAFGQGNSPAVSQAAPAPLVEPLSRREQEVLQLAAEGLSNQEIAQRLVVSLATVKTHLLNVYGKLGVSSRMQAVAQARALGILTSP
jgi:LuxR family maltose regulon positive regulatory protein